MDKLSYIHVSYSWLMDKLTYIHVSYSWLMDKLRAVQGLFLSSLFKHLQLNSDF